MPCLTADQWRKINEEVRGEVYQVLRSRYRWKHAKARQWIDHIHAVAPKKGCYHGDKYRATLFRRWAELVSAELANIRWKQLPKPASWYKGETWEPEDKRYERYAYGSGCESVLRHLGGRLDRQVKTLTKVPRLKEPGYFARWFPRLP